MVPDALSRAPIDDQRAVHGVPTDVEDRMFACLAAERNPTPTELAELQAGCDDCSSLIKVLQGIPVAHLSDGDLEEIKSN